MQKESEKFIESLNYATRALQVADHLTYVTYPLVKEKRLLLKILSELNDSLLNAINSLLQYEYAWKRIQLYSDARENFRTFKNIAGRYEISDEQIGKIMEIMALNEKHRKSSFEFVKNDRIVIMSDNLKQDYLTLEKVKQYLLEVKDVLRKVGIRVKS